jgi:endonuclease I
MKLRRLSTALLLMAAMVSWAQAPHGTGTYYQKANGKKGRELKTAFFEIIRNPSVVHYDSLWNAYNTSDKRVLNEQEIIWDMYSGISRYPLYTYPHGTGSGSTEGVKGIQREHSMPKKWFNPTDAPASGSKSYQDVRPMYSDLTHLIPTDAVCNNNRSDLCYGEIADPSQVDWTSQEGFSKKSKQGGCSTPGWAEQVANPSKTRVFEINDEYKGDLARIYFYMVTCYQPNYFSWVPVRNESKVKTGEAAQLSGNHCGTWVCDMFNTADTDEGLDSYQPFAPWALDMLMRWSKNDPVSQKEIDRNATLWQFQGNRNPFVDYPGLEDYIWGEKKDVAFDYGGELPEAEPTSDNCEVALNKTTFGVDWSANVEPNQRDYWIRTPIVFEKNGVTFTFSYGMEGKNLYADAQEIRLYNYNTLTVTAHNNELTKIEVNVTGRNHDNKTLVASVGSIDNNNVWTGSAQEVILASNYVSSTKSGGVSNYYYLGLDNVKVTVANPSGIEQMKAQRYDDDRIYNLMGVQMNVSDLVPGIYIKNGRKFVVK